MSNILINAEFEGKGKEAKGTTVKAQVLKTKTKVEFQAEKKKLAELDLQGDFGEDVELLAVEALPMSLFHLTVEGVPAIGRMVNRSAQAFSKLDIVITPLEWEDDNGVIEFMGDFTGLDFPFLAELSVRIVRRALRSMSYTHHPLTLFDLKQACGIVYDLQQGLDGAEELADWIGVREAVVLEELKAAKAKEKAKAKAAKKAKAEDEAPEEAPKAKPKAKTSTKAKAAAAKAKAKAKAKNSGKAKTANLADLA